MRSTWPYPLLAVPLALALALVAADRTPAPLSPEEAVKSIKLPDGFRATLFAAEPDVVQPIAFAIDDRGRLFVAEALSYGTWQATGRDRIVILEDTDGDGRADSRKVFYEGFNYITGIEVGFGGVWVMSPPGLYFIPDRNRDDKPDGPPVLLFDGFGYKESRHNLANGFTWGPDGWLYGGHGRTSPSDVGRPGTPADKRIHCDGGVFRVHPTRLVYENFADGTTNPWGVDFDDYGQCFVSNCVNPHLFHMIQGGHYEPWRNRPSSLYAYDRLPTIADHLHYPAGKPNAMRGETPEVLDLGGGHAHCGTLIYLGGAFPADYRNTVFMCNVHGRRINNDRLRRVGSGYTASHGSDFALWADPWFMGVTLRSGPDGSVFVSDWSDTGECHTLKPDTKTGRIYKISHGPPDRTREDLATLSDAELVNRQRSANDWQVRHARRILQERATEKGWDAAPVHAALREQLASKELDVPRRLRAMWALHVTDGLHSATLLNDRSEHLRAWAIQLLCETGEPSPAVRAKFIQLAKSDPSPVVRLYLASAMQRLQRDTAWLIGEALAGHAEDATDANLPLLIWYGLEPLVIADPDRAFRLATAAKIPLVRRHIARRIGDDAASKGDKADLAPLVQALARADDTARLDLLNGTREGLRGRKSMPLPTGWAELATRLRASENASVREQSRWLAVLFGDPVALKELRATAESRSAPTAERIAALESLVEKRLPDLGPLLHSLLTDRDLRRAALRGLAAIPHESTPALILARYADFNPDERAEAIATLASRPAFALDMLDAVEKKTVPRTDVSAYTARQLHALNDPKVTARLKQVWGEVRDSAPEKRTALAKYTAQLTPNTLKNADLRNGKAVYVKTCAACHKLFGEGGTIGPDLTGSNRSNIEYLLSNIIDPSAEVARDYRMSVISLENGRVITGIVVERTPARIVVQTATEKVTLASEDVDTVKDSALSIMPEGQLDSLTKEQVRDLIAYLGSKK